METKDITLVIIPGKQIHRATTENSSMTSKSVLRYFHSTCSELTTFNDPVVKDKFSCSLFLSKVIELTVRLNLPDLYLMLLNIYKFNANFKAKGTILS